MSFATRLKALRKKCHYTQRKLAQEMGVSVSIVEKWEIGERSPTLETAVKVARFFGLTLSEMLEDAAEESSRLAQLNFKYAKYDELLELMESMEPEMRDRLEQRIKTMAQLFPREDAQTHTQSGASCSLVIACGENG